MTTRVSRLAPSPTGALHLGNARTFLINWAIARSEGWRLLMRIEDLDGPRIKPQATADALDTLAWMGLDFDGVPLYQSADLEPYRRAVRHLAMRRQVYRCELTRREIAEAGSAPHADGTELRCPPELRPGASDAYRFEDDEANYRFVVEPGAIEIDDAVGGRVVLHPHDEVGDFVIWTRRATPAYQLAVVVDDIRQGVTDVVRGNDLLPSTGRQVLLYEALEHAPPRWWHLPLVVGEDGRRLAKRHGDTRIASYRAEGVGPQRIVGLLAFWCGITDRRTDMTAEDFRRRFEPARLSPCPITFTSDDHRWLLCGSP